jgi:hypothetical protein
MRLTLDYNCITNVYIAIYAGQTPDIPGQEPRIPTIKHNNPTPTDNNNNNDNATTGILRAITKSAPDSYPTQIQAPTYSPMEYLLHHISNQNCE